MLNVSFRSTERQTPLTTGDADRYEFWLYYRQIRKRLESGELYLDDSLQHQLIKYGEKQPGLPRGLLFICL